MAFDDMLRHELVNLLELRQAHMQFEDAVKDFPMEHINTHPHNLEYSFWHLVDHIRFCQWDILDYCINPNYEHVEWPRDYWPPRDQDTNEAGWAQSINQFLADRARLVSIIQDPAFDLMQVIPHGNGKHTIFREVLVVAQHNSYHIGELASLRGTLNLWAQD